ncbi:Uncharacterised protein [Vibrio cholerae]|uniref:Uncharacterized protein n=1 Tax=Vibrio cholerae TaxID=666 RepID=A0A656AYX2_VIBCL|nr:Uncharacterised protein [Vibrio cholerae]
MHHQQVTGLDSEFSNCLRYCLPRMHRDISSKLQNTIPIERHCCKVSDEAAFCLIQRPYISNLKYI